MSIKDQDSIVATLKTQGVCIIDNYLDSRECQQLKKEFFETPRSRYSPTGIEGLASFALRKNIYCPEPFISSRRLAAKLVLDSRLRRIESKVFKGVSFFLKNSFAYQINNPSLKVFDWHIDNYNERTGKKDGSIGVVYLCYLDSHEMGGTEFLLGSNSLTSQVDDVFFSASDDRLKEFKSLYVLPKEGRLVIARADLIHRGATSVIHEDLSTMRSRSVLRWQSTSEPVSTTHYFISAELVKMLNNQETLTYLSNPSSSMLKPQLAIQQEQDFFYEIIHLTQTMSLRFKTKLSNLKGFLRRQLRL